MNPTLQMKKLRLKVIQRGHIELGFKPKQT